MASYVVVVPDNDVVSATLTEFVQSFKTTSLTPYMRAELNPNSLLNNIDVYPNDGYEITGITSTLKGVSGKPEDGNSWEVQLNKQEIPANTTVTLYVHTKEINKQTEPSQPSQPEISKKSIPFKFSGEGFNVIPTDNVVLKDGLYYIDPDVGGNFKITPKEGYSIDPPRVKNEVYFEPPQGITKTLQSLTVCFVKQNDGTYIGSPYYFDDYVSCYSSPDGYVEFGVRSDTKPVQPIDPEKPEVGSTTPYISLYSMDNDSLYRLGNSTMLRHITVGHGDSAEYVEIENSTMFILNMLQLDIKLPESTTPVKGEIKIGSTRTGITVPVFNTDTPIFDVGSITVPPASSSLNYKNVDVELLLPSYEGTIRIDPNDVYGKTVRVEYCLNLTSGDLTVNLYNGDSKPFRSIQTAIGRNIPVKLNELPQVTVGTQRNVKSGIINPVIRITSPELVAGECLNLITKQGKIGSYVGYCQVLNMSLESRATYGERSLIETLLRSGVFVNPVL